MDSMNNWLGFSLSPQQVLLSQPSQNLGLNSDEISAGTEEVSGECFDLTSETTIPSLNPPAPFGILEAFNRNNQSQDWNLKEMSMNSFSCSSQNLENQEGPRLENFLGGHSYNDEEHKKYQSSTCNNITASSYIYQEPEATSHPTSNHGGIGMNDNSTIGLSMIKNWLRNNPAPPQSEENTTRNEADAPPSTASAQTLSLSMSTGSQSDSPSPFLNGNVGESSTLDSKQHSRNALDSQTGAIDTVPRKSIDTFGQRTSIYRGVTRHRWTGRYEAHLWDNSCRREGQTRKGRQVYLGGYDKEEKAARAYDLAALKYWGSTTTTNFPISNYEKELEEMKDMTRQEYVASLRRKSSGFSRGASIYRGVTRHHQHGRWQARIGRVAGNKDLYLGTFSTQEEAAEAYDIAAIKFRGLNAVTNFEINRYDVKSIMESSTLPIGGAAKRLKDAENAELALDRASNGNPNSHLADRLNGYNNGWPNSIAFHQPQPLSMHYPYPQQRYLWCKQEHDLEVNRNIHDLHQLQSGNMQNFLQPSVLHNLMSLDSSSMEHNPGSNSLVYSNGTGGDVNRHSASYQLGDANGSNGNFAAPMGMMLVQEGLSQNQTSGFVENEVKPLSTSEKMFGTGDPYQTRNLISYESQQSSDGMEKASVYDQASANCNNWMPTGVPTLAARPNNVAVCHGGSIFTVWNDT